MALTAPPGASLGPAPGLSAAARICDRGRNSISYMVRNKTDGPTGPGPPCAGTEGWMRTSADRLMKRE
jgi:hypothetical protein